MATSDRSLAQQVPPSKKLRLPLELIDMVTDQVVLNSTNDAEVRELRLVHSWMNDRFRDFQFTEEHWDDCTSVSKLKTRLRGVNYRHALQLRSLALPQPAPVLQIMDMENSLHSLSFSQPQLVLRIADMRKLLHSLPALRVLRLAHTSLYADTEGSESNTPHFTRVPMAKLSLKLCVVQKYVDRDERPTGTSLDDFLDLFSDIETLHVSLSEYHYIFRSPTRKAFSLSSAITINKLSCVLPPVSKWRKISDIWNAVTYHKVLLADVQVAYWPYVTLDLPHHERSPGTLRLRAEEYMEDYVDEGEYRTAL